MGRVLGPLGWLVPLTLLAVGCGVADRAPGVDGSDTRAASVVAEEADLAGSEPDRPYEVAPVTLVDTSDGDYTLASDPPHDLTLVFFGYSSCPDICPMVLASLASALPRLDEADRRRVGVVVVTTDPARDDRRTLRAYLDRFDPSFEGLTGPISEILELGRSLKVHISEGKALPDGGYEVDHSTPVIGLDAEHRGVVVWSQDTSPAQFASDIETLLARAGR